MSQILSGSHQHRVPGCNKVGASALKSSVYLCSDGNAKTGDTR